MNIVICDDSALARKSLQRCIDPNLPINTFLCANGQEAMATISETNIDLMFLDLTMPEMDGYEVLEALAESRFATNVVVISGDVQEEAKRRCFDLGANDFIAKPFNKEQVQTLIQEFIPTAGGSSFTYQHPIEPVIDPITKFKEITNIALGRGAAIISDRIGNFIDLCYAYYNNPEDGSVPTIGTVTTGC